MPEAAPTAAMRADIDQNPERIKAVLIDDKMRSAFLDGASKKEKDVVAAFTAGNAGNALKTKPKGYDADNENIELLKLRNYTVGKNLPDDHVLGAEGMDRITDLLQSLKPFVTYLNSVVMPDEAGSEEEDSEEASTSGESVGD